MFEKELRFSAVAWAAFFLFREFFPQSPLIGIALLVCLLISAGAAISRFATKRASQSWPSVLGSVEFTSVLDNQGRSKLLYPHMLHIAYSYVAAGERYSGFYEQKFRRESDADALARRLKASGLMVRYNPRVPDKSLGEVMPGTVLGARA
jgi:hypothetical protein